MALANTPYLLLPLVAGCLSLGLVGYAWRFRDRSTGPPFLVLVTAIAVWSLLDAVQVAAVDPTAQLALQRVGIAVGAVIPTAWLVLTLRYADYGHLLERRRLAALAAEPVVFALLSLTDSWHGLVWQAIRPGPGPMAVARYVPGPAYLAHIAYAYLLVVTGIGLLLSVALDTARLRRRQATLLAGGAIVPLGVNVLFTVGASPVPGLDLTTSTFALTAVILALALFRYDLLDLAPAAYRRVSDLVGDGLLVFDDEGSLVEYNDHAAAIVDAPLTAGERPGDLLPSDGPAGLDGRILTRHDEGRRYYEASHTPIRDAGSVAGHAVVLREVTDSIQYEQRLEVANRVLRHNLRNELTVIAGNVEVLRDEHPDEEALDTISDAADRLADISEEARIAQSLLEGDGTSTTVDAAALARQVCDRYEATNLTVEAPETAHVRAYGTTAVETAIDNLVENAVDHAGEQPTVRVSVTADDEWVTITVADDGPGIPPVERDVVADGSESQLEHGSGLGLWLVKWAVSSVGGDFSFDDDGDGARVTVRLPAAQP